MRTSLAFDIAVAIIAGALLALALIMLDHPVRGGTIADRWPRSGDELVAKADKLQAPHVVAARWPDTAARLPAMSLLIIPMASSDAGTGKPHHATAPPHRHHHAHRWRHKRPT